MECNLRTVILLLLFIPGLIYSIDIPGEINLGKLENYNTVKYPLALKNDSNQELEVTFLPLCDCITVDPLNLIVPENTELEVNILLTPEGHDQISRHILVDLNGKKQPIRVFAKLPPPPVEVLSNGCPECLIKERELEDIKNMEKELSNWIVADIYYSPGCKTCEEFLKNTVPQISSALNRKITVRKHNVLEPENLERLEVELKAIGAELKEFPILIYRDISLQGKSVDYKNFTEAIKNELPTEIKDNYKEKYLEPLPVLFAGLIDGINPCAFTTLIFLISTLFYIGKGRKEILYIGIIFSSTIFVSYYLVGLGLLNAIRTAMFFPVVGKIIKVAIISALVIFTILSFYDAILIKKGLTKEMKLQLPKSLKKRIHTTIRNNTRKRGIIIGTIIIGIMVTIFELACTGQIYLPIITYIIKIEGSLSAYIYLTIYNLGFILPLLTVFILIYKGITNTNITTWFQSKLLLIKILLGALFLLMIFIII